MPPSQLKRLKASLREQGITGPQRSKKQKKSQGGGNPEQKARRNAALTQIRESFNPFEFKTPARPKKFDVTTSRPDRKNAVGRPGVSKSMGEETRRRTLLPEMNRRNKVGGILDRRIGENDPTMSVEDKMIERYTRENQRRKGASVFDLEEEDDEEALTHMGRALDLGSKEKEIEDYDAASVEASSEDEGQDIRSRKRRRDSEEQDEDGNGVVNTGKPERKKSKAEVMKEVMAKAKLHKYERQQAKEDDDDLREELDKDLHNILAALRGHLSKPPPVPAREAPPKVNDFAINPDRAALLNGKEREVADKEYDARVRQLLYDQKAKPTERIKTEEEKAEDEAARLKKLEEQRLRRMRGEPVEEEVLPTEEALEDEEDEYVSADDAAEFGLSAAQNTSRPEGVDDEDDFVLDDGLVASESDFDDESSNDSDGEDGVPDDTQDLEDDEFFKEVLPNVNGRASTRSGTGAPTSKLAYTYPCPRSQEELLSVLEGVASTDIPVVIQRIRALYHPQLHHENKAKLVNFAVVLVDYIKYLSSQTSTPSLALIETVIRHIHSLSRTFPEQIARAFRVHLQRLHESNDPSPGDLTILTAISTIYPTSDHFHQVVTPAITLMARWLEMSTPRDVKDLTMGAYIGVLCLQYQRLSKRYIPELVRYTTAALKSPFATPDLLDLHIKNLTAMADLWSSKSAFPEIFSPFLTLLKHLKQPKALQRLQILLQQSRLARQPLELHHHRPLPIKTSVPKFEEGFNPDRHYDPDVDRAAAAKLRAEYKKERKGALRELRKDSNFIAREQLREKKERDRAYEVKYKRLVAEIQGEEGKEKNAYEREKRARKGKGGK